MYCSNSPVESPPHNENKRASQSTLELRFERRLQPQRFDCLRLFCRKSKKLCFISKIFCIFASSMLTPLDGWARTATYWEASLMLCFWPFERRKLKLVIRDKCGDECYGCSIYSRSVPRAVHALTHTFGDALYTWPAWVFRLCSFFTSGILRPKRGTADEDTPLFVCGSLKITNHSGIWVSVRANSCHWPIWSLMKRL